eukprot:488209_1
MAGSEGRRRLVEYSDELVIEKCIMGEMENVFICVLNGYDDMMVFVYEYDSSYDINRFKNGYMETYKWIVNGKSGCNDNFVNLLLMGYSEVCVNDDGNILINKEYNDGNMVFSLMDEWKWNEIYDMNGNMKKYCEYVLGKNKLCVEFEMGNKGEYIKQINEISIEKML